MNTNQIIKALETASEAMNEKTICIRFYGVAEGWDFWLDAQEIVEDYDNSLEKWISEALQTAGFSEEEAEKEADIILGRDTCVVDDEGGLVGCFTSYAHGWGYMNWDGLKEALEADLNKELAVAALENGIELSELEDRYFGEFGVSLSTYMNRDEATSFAEHYAEQTGLLEELPETLRNYFDFEKFGRDLAFDFTFVDSGRIENMERIYYAFHN
ncbi:MULTISPECIES: antirestriction protein ArdA [unclassified Vibrio]|uniref:Antirestriction protein ArdA n=1 Tax=Vibrio sp. HB236076 TaxID=3232307 RepID=A0AB39HB86_9VIBR|nr:antirestriction protein ArdA [Vibrio sp. HB161653]MDP5253360.1 antirestriction protein ArdA [Vibrio sp. HB161653]